MTDMLNWIKTHKLVVFIISLLIILGVPLVIHLLFKLHPSSDFFVAEWTAGEALGYYGSILSFIGTVVLGFLALYQNQVIKEESDKREAMLMKMEHEKDMPKFTATAHLTHGNCSELSFYLENISENIATEVKLHGFTIQTLDGKTIWRAEKSFRIPSLPAYQKHDISLSNPGLQRDRFLLGHMECKDKYNDTHCYELRGEYQTTNPYPVLTITELT